VLAWLSRIAAVVLALCACDATAIAADRPGVVFGSDFADGVAGYTKFTHAERITIVDDPYGVRTPSGSVRKVARFTVHDDDIGPTPNPRAGMSSPPFLAEGQEWWFGWSTAFPSTDFTGGVGFRGLAPPGFPPYVPGWLVFESVYGPPHAGPGPRHFGVEGSEIMWRRNGTYGWDVAWEMPLIRDRWIDFVVHQKMSRDPHEGFVELWIDTAGGWTRQLLDGRPRLYTRTLDASNDQATLYMAEHRIGTSFAAVAPSSYRSDPGPG
jgi:hypothetical protein